MKKQLEILILLVLFIPMTAGADEFSLFGVKMGMQKKEVDKIWPATSDGQYQIPGSTLYNVLPEYDHRNRLYSLSFSVPIPLLDQYPGPYATTAFQQVVQERWGASGYTVNLRTGRGVGDITVTSKLLKEEYDEHIKSQMEFQLQTILDPQAQQPPGIP